MVQFLIYYRILLTFNKNIFLKKLVLNVLNISPPTVAEC